MKRNEVKYVDKVNKYIHENIMTVICVVYELK